MQKGRPIANVQAGGGGHLVARHGKAFIALPTISITKLFISYRAVMVMSGTMQL